MCACVWRFHFQVLWENSIEVRLGFTLQIKKRVKHLSSPNKGTDAIFRLFERTKKFYYGINNICSTSEWWSVMLEDERCFFTLTSWRSVCFCFFFPLKHNHLQAWQNHSPEGPTSIPLSNFLHSFCLIFFSSHFQVFLYTSVIVRALVCQAAFHFDSLYSTSASHHRMIVCMATIRVRFFSSLFPYTSS